MWVWNKAASLVRLGRSTPFHRLSISRPARAVPHTLRTRSWDFHKGVNDPRGFHTSIACRYDDYEDDLNGGEMRIKGMNKGRRSRDDDDDFYEHKKKKKKKPSKIVPRNIMLSENTSVMDVILQSGESIGPFMARLHHKTGDRSYKPETILPYEEAVLIVEEMGHNPEQIAFTQNQLKRPADENIDKFKPRSPVVTILGHVDHGKTSLLDFLRTANVAAGEAGGITQHIGAFKVTTSDGDEITFLDTPGHEAFTDMRKRGAECTDIAILVVAATEGCQAQTVKQILDVHNKVLKGAGPSTACHITGWDSLPPAGAVLVEVASEKVARSILDKRNSQSERLESLKRQTDSSRLSNKDQKIINEAKLGGKTGPDDAPRLTRRDKRFALRQKLAAENWDKVETKKEYFVDDPEYDFGEQLTLPVVIRGDVEGTVSALQQSLVALKNRKIKTDVIASGVGPITESDIDRAITAEGAVVAFNAPCPAALERMAEKADVHIIKSKVIYHILDEVKEQLSQRLPKLKTREVDGAAIVNEVFPLRDRNKSVVAGCRVTEGQIKKKSLYRVRRGNQTLWDGQDAEELRHHKDVVPLVKNGQDCGIRLDGFGEYEVGDIIETYHVVYVDETFDPGDV
ncbi:hypothetical protein SARC_03942 [Sphaeroforma arctica JP610]|uniref:Tr-type G domain-containing protein n=1 Tax=Sphaeroforma arctica JP610 TaxID=667725 RepID=A0A0L0G6F6_9EUKA|nr:hypothetical protein SARC_03942 [Sphaeroforma arctica JP610]KNC83813.1 hypothetical protein SARC_03942 [Sphaeroforma arctica JP610]|eukprot:XP_014157715.1 hypothetical protein SARC_03942 [Sphaeroforma arctica JP610]